VQDSYRKIERLVFLQNYSSPLLTKEAALLCAHAVLSKNESVPRVYLSDNLRHDPYWVWNTISTCLLSNQTLQDWTLSSLKLLHISPKELQKLPNEERFECIRLIEENLDATMGDGHIYYEKLRFTPFVSEDIAQLLLQVDAPSNISQSTLYKRLRERSFAKIQYCQKHAEIIHDLNLRGDWDIFHSVYKFKLEQVWQQSWLDLERYQTDLDIVNTILVGDSFED